MGFRMIILHSFVKKKTLLTMRSKQVVIFLELQLTPDNSNLALTRTKIDFRLTYNCNFTLGTGLEPSITRNSR